MSEAAKWEKRARSRAKALLQAERQSVGAATKEVAAFIESVAKPLPSDPAAAKRAIIAASKKLDALVVKLVESTEATAAESASKQNAADFDALKIPDVNEPKQPKAPSNATKLAAGLAAAWLALALLSSKKDDPKRWVKGTAGLTEGRLRRIIATESAKSFNRSHAEWAKGLAKANPRSPWLGRVFRRWDARLDRTVCAVCESHDGEETQVGKPFKLGHEPGSVHPFCRCVSTIVFFPADEDRVVFAKAA